MGDAERYREAVNYEFDLLTRLLLETQQTFDQVRRWSQLQLRR